MQLSIGKQLTINKSGLDETVVVRDILITMGESKCEIVVVYETSTSTHQTGLFLFKTFVDGAKTI